MVVVQGPLTNHVQVVQSISRKPLVRFTLKMASDRTLLPPTPLLDDFEVSVHTPPRALLYELDMVFPNVDCTKNSLVCILSAQKSKMKLLEWNDEVAKRKRFAPGTIRRMG